MKPGTPHSAHARGVRVNLSESLRAPRVIEQQAQYSKLLLNAVILRVRPPRKARY